MSISFKPSMMVNMAYAGICNGTALRAALDIIASNDFAVEFQEG
jgi:hypothetical protein